MPPLHERDREEFDVGAGSWQGPIVSGPAAVSLRLTDVEADIVQIYQLEGTMVLSMVKPASW